MQSFKLRHLTKKWAITVKGVMSLKQRIKTRMSETFIEI
jgi:hypothetical protein